MKNKIYMSFYFIIGFILIIVGCLFIVLKLNIMAIIVFLISMALFFIDIIKREKEKKKNVQ